jgi:hypothetical protein
MLRALLLGRRVFRDNLCFSIPGVDPGQMRWSLGVRLLAAMVLGWRLQGLTRVPQRSPSGVQVAATNASQRPEDAKNLVAT